MQKVFVLLLTLTMSLSAYSQKVGAYAFARTPQLVNYNFESSKSTFSQGVSAGIGITHKSLFMELGAFILQGDSYGYYSFFGSTLHTTDLDNSVKLNTNLFGEVTNIPSQPEQLDRLFIFTSGVCFSPNIQIKKMNIGIPLCFGIAYQDDAFSLNSRFILNLSLSIK